MAENREIYSKFYGLKLESLWISIESELIPFTIIHSFADGVN